MSLSSGQTLTVGGQDLTKDGGGRAPWEDVKPSTPTRKPKTPKPQDAITIAVSARVLFNMEKEQQIYEQRGVEEYVKYQVEHETEPFRPGPAFSFVKALEAVNAQLRELYTDSEELFDVVLMTNNHAYVGLRLINTINHHRECLTPRTTRLTPRTTRLTSVTTRLTPITTRLTPITTRLTPITTRLTPITTRLTPITTRLTPITTRLTP
ncbi:cytosolic 5'-nucleotidase 1A-like, partial [Brachyistius frenatus]|uniref:cytosolic 5'-nucleotidase 1A-like n=1 Tax=Brachyistius frenatus TaxID=100188 RepID=UPI0037E850BE